MSSVLLYNIVNNSKGNEVPESYFDYSNPVAVPFEYLTYSPEVTGFSHALIDKKSNVHLQLGLLSWLVCERLTGPIGT